MAFRETPYNAFEGYERTGEAVALFLCDFYSGMPILGIVAAIDEENLKRIKSASDRDSLVINMYPEVPVRSDSKGDEKEEANKVLIKFFSKSDSGYGLEFLHQTIATAEGKQALSSLIQKGFFKYEIKEIDNGRLYLFMYYDNEKVRFRFLGAGEKPKNEDGRAVFIKNVLKNWPIFTHEVMMEQGNTEKLKEAVAKGLADTYFFEEGGNLEVEILDKSKLPKDAIIDEALIEQARIAHFVFQLGETSDLVMTLYKMNALIPDIAYYGGKTYFRILVDFNRFEIMLNDDTPYIV